LISNKKERLENKDKTGEFVKRFNEWVMQKRIKLLNQLRTYPETQYFHEYINYCETFSQEFYKKVGNVAIITGSAFLPKNYMATSDQKPNFSLQIIKENKDYDYNLSSDIRTKYGFNGSISGWFWRETRNSIVEKCKENQFKDLSSPLEFLASFAVNSFTKDLQKKVYSALKPNVQDLDTKIIEKKAGDYSFESHEFKQKSHIEEQHHPQKKKIKEEKIPIFKMRTLNFEKYLPYFHI
jgi:hypothetical protein